MTFELSIGEEEKQVVDNLESPRISIDNWKKKYTHTHTQIYIYIYKTFFHKVSFPFWEPAEFIIVFNLKMSVKIPVVQGLKSTN